jgi:hypothetical protein
LGVVTVHFELVAVAVEHLWVALALPIAEKY